MPNDSNSAHLTKFKDLVEVLNFLNISMFEDNCLIDFEKDKDFKAGRAVKSNSEYETILRNKKITTCFLRCFNLRIYSPFLDDLRDQYLVNSDQNPETLEGEYFLLQNHSSHKKRWKNVEPGREHGVTKEARSGTPTRKKSQSPPLLKSSSTTTT